MGLKPEVRQWLDDIEVGVAQRKISASGLYTQMRYAITIREERLEDLDKRCEAYQDHAAQTNDLLRKTREQLAQAGNAHLINEIDHLLSKAMHQ